MSTLPTGPEIEGLTFLQQLGSGGYTDVYLYERQNPRMKVAVKVLKDGRLTKPERRQFAAEAETMAELDHPYIVPVFFTGVTVDGRPFLVMKFYPQTNLAVRAATERYSIAQVLRTGIQIASAVETAHEAGILHRDIKPANILLGTYGEPGLTDFGIAGRATQTDEDDDDLGVSIPWSPPELLNSASNGSVTSDVYSLGATIWNLLVGRSPFEIPGGDNRPRALVKRVLHTPAPSTGRADVPPSLERLLQQALAKPAGQRPQSALQLARDLQSIEQSLRLSRTEIVVASTQPRPTAFTPGPSPVDGTQLRRPARPNPSPKQGGDGPAGTVARPARPDLIVSSVPGMDQIGTAGLTPPDGPRSEPISSVPGRVPTGVKGELRNRSGSSADDTPRTERRPLVAQPVAEEPDPGRRRIRLPYVIGALATVLAAVMVVAIVLASRGGGGGNHGGAPGVAQATDGTGAAIAGPPSVTSTYDVTTHRLTFRFTPPRGTTFSTYLVYRGASDDDTPVPANRISYTTERPRGVCVVVVGIPADGATSQRSPHTCGATP